MAHGFKATEIAWSADVGSSAERLTLLALAKWANDDLTCFPSLSTLVTDTKLNEKTIREALKRLHEAGLITIKRQAGHNTRYAITPTKIGSTKNGSTEIGTPTKIGSTPLPKTAGAPLPKTVPEHISKQIKNREENSNYSTSDVGTPPTSDVGRRNQIRNQIRNNKRATKVALNFYGVSEQIVEDWKANRKAKRAVISQSVIDGLKKKADEARRLGHPEWNLEAIMREQVARAWQGFELSWVLKEDKQPKLPPLELTPEAKARRRAEALRAQRQAEEDDQPGIFEDLVGQVWEEVRRAPG